MGVHGARRGFFFASLGLLTLGFARGELATLLWGGFFGLFVLYALLGQLAQRWAFHTIPPQSWKLAQPLPIPEAGSPVRLTWSGPTPQPWPLFQWSLDLDARHSPGRVAQWDAPPAHEIVAPLGRGRYEARARWRLGDQLGLTQWLTREGASSPVLVYATRSAATAPRPPLLPTSSPGSRRVPRREGEALDVRQFHWGDDTRRLHWALWAHSGQAWLRIPDWTPPPTGLALWVLDLSMPPRWSPRLAEEALDARVAPLAQWLSARPNSLLAVPATRQWCRDLDELPALLASLTPSTHLPSDLSWVRGTSGPIVVVTGADCPGGQHWKALLEPQHRVQLVVVPLPGPNAPRRAWWRRP